MTEEQVIDAAADVAADVAVDQVPADTVEQVASTESLSPGSVLRRAREGSGQSIADVVQVIRFSARQIEALERDDYASLPGSTAVRGLVRNYAKFLKLDAAPLLAQLDPAVPVPEADVRPPANMGEAEELTMVERVPLRLVASVAGVLILALLAYLYSTLPADPTTTQQLRDAAVPPSVQVAAPAVVALVQPEPAVVATGESAAAGSPPSVPPPGGLRVEFDDRSWVEIRDATQKIVFVGEYPAGTRQNVEGKAPFQVWIGKASGVRLFMGERSIDLRPHTREEVARFSLE
jgi:cytoskeleton protein RodZ